LTNNAFNLVKDVDFTVPVSFFFLQKQKLAKIKNLGIHVEEEDEELLQLLH